MLNDQSRQVHQFAIGDRVSYSGQGKQLAGTITKLYELERMNRYVVDFDDESNGVFYENELEHLRDSSSEPA